MNLSISHVFSVQDSHFPKLKYISVKNKIMKFRVHELRELLVFLNMESTGFKGFLQDRLLDYFKKEIEKNYLLPENLEKKIAELDESCKIPLKELDIQFVEPLYDKEYFPMFSELRPLVSGQKFRFENGKQTVQFKLTAHIIRQIASGKQKDGSFRFEIQLNVWNFRSTEEWEDIYLDVEVNKKLLDIIHPSPHLIYLTSSCILESSVRNTIVISSPRPNTLKGFGFCVCAVKRFFPMEIISTNSVKEACDTTPLITELIDGKVNRIFKMSLTCPSTKEVITHPCRSTLCTHPEVFDLKTLLDDMQYYQQWKCPICKKIMTYENIVMDMYLKKNLENGKYSFAFYKRRPYVEPSDNKEVNILEETIIIDE